MTERSPSDLPERSGDWADVADRPATEPANAPESPRRATRPESSAPPTTKTGVAFGSLMAGAVVLILLLVFILENTQSVKVSFFGASGR